VLRGHLQAVDHAQHLVEIAARGHRIDQDQLDLLVRPDHEHVAHGLIVGRRALQGIARDRRRKHAVELGDVEIDIADHRIVRLVALRLLDVGGPAGMTVDRVDREADDLDAALVELGLDLRHVAELGGADRREVLRMREQDGPFVADPVVEFDAAFGGVGLEIRCRVIQRDGHVICSWKKCRSCRSFRRGAMQLGWIDMRCIDADRLSKIRINSLPIGLGGDSHRHRE
jgi:hypothetical protein